MQLLKDLKEKKQGILNAIGYYQKEQAKAEAKIAEFQQTMLELEVVIALLEADKKE